MAKYGISNEGVTALRKLATDMSTLNSDIEANGIKLTTAVSGLSDGLGIYEEQILELISSVNSTQAKGRESVQTLTTKVNKLADDVEDLVNMGL